MAKKKQSIHKMEVKQARQVRKNPQTIFHLLKRVVLLAVAVVAVVLYTDKRGYFNPDYTNDHTRRKWNVFYQFIRNQPIDIVMVGNSHLYTGLNPDNLSNTLGANCFILASPGTTLTDSYYCLKEAITANKPKAAIVETFTIYNYDSHALKDGQLSDQFKSFAARKNFMQKLYSTPQLFASDNYLAAWSNTIRNHHFLFTDKEQIRKNLNYKEPIRTGLYLGRYNRFTSGLEDSTLLKYNVPGFIAYDYGKNMPSDEAKMYIRKTIELCQKHDVQLIFLTLPMYYRHAHNYEVYKNELKKLIGQSHHWVDFQLPYDTIAFNADCFENTVAGNQHMTYYGARVAAYKLAHYLKKHVDGLPDRSAYPEWKQLFYASDGYFENHPPVNDGVSQLLLQNTRLGADNNLLIREISLVPDGEAKKLIVKVLKEDVDLLHGKTLHLRSVLSINGQTVVAELSAACTLAYDPADFYVFISEPLNPAITIQQVLGLRLS